MLSESRRFYQSYKNPYIFFLIRCKILFSAGRIINTAIHLKDYADAILIDHAVYVNGLYLEVFYKYKKVIYSNGFPKGFFVIDATNKRGSSYLNTSSVFKVNAPYKISDYQKKISFKKIKNNLINPKNITYMKKVTFKELDRKIDFSQVSHVVYAHSFTDAQLPYGTDGFSDTLDWLIFTIENLVKLKTKIIIKGHPNFYNKNPNELSKVDKQIFQEIVNKFSDNKNLIFLNSSIKNFDLLNNIRKETILVTHHGTLIFDASILKNKVITSSQTFYDKKFKITETWDNVNQYKKLLKKNHKEIYMNYNKLLNIGHELYFNKYNTYGKNFYVKTILKYIKIRSDNMGSKKISNDLQKLPYHKRKKLFYELEKKIEPLSFN